MLSKWIGPKQISDVRSPFVYEVKDIINEVRETVHVQRMRYYSDHLLNTNVQFKEQIVHDNSVFEVEDIIDWRWIDGRYQLNVKWLGFEVQDSSWEDLQELVLTYPLW